MLSTTFFDFFLTIFFCQFSIIFANFFTFVSDFCILTSLSDVVNNFFDFFLTIFSGIFHRFYANFPCIFKSFFVSDRFYINTLMSDCQQLFFIFYLLILSLYLLIGKNAINYPKNRVVYIFKVYHFCSYSIIFKNSSSVIIVTPNSCALINLLPASSPANT